MDTKSNTADYAHRGLSVQELFNNSIWWNGAEFVWQHFDLSDNSLDSKNTLQLDDSDPEAKKVVSCVTQIKGYPAILQRLNYFSHWFRAKRRVAVCLDSEECSRRMSTE